MERADKMQLGAVVKVVVMREKLLYAVFSEQGDATFAYGEIDLLGRACFDDRHDVNMGVVLHIFPYTGDVFSNFKRFFFREHI